jgi:3-deoxy-D-manno-octulosonic-acid transferase
MSDPEFRDGRLGRYASVPGPEKRPRIWFHAVSVGEVTGAVPTILATMKKIPEAAVWLTCGTPQGISGAREKLPASVPVLPFPADFPEGVRRAVDTLRPDLYVGFETEFWPNFFRCLRENGVPAVLLNGRLSARSVSRYRLLSPLFSPVFRQFERFAMHSEEDLQNILRCGAPPERCLVLGSSKYDGLAERADPAKEAFWRKLLDLPSGRPVLIGGSLRGSECTAVMSVFKELLKTEPGLTGIFVPRHLKNVGPMQKWLEGEGVSYHLLSRIESGIERCEAPAVLVDRIGALFGLYSVGDLIFCGGSLEPVGGHNILEPAAWGKPVFYGPHLQKVMHEHRILQLSGASFPVRSAADLLDQWRGWLGRLPELNAHGASGRQALQSIGKVVDRQVEIIADVLSAGTKLRPV